MKTGYLAGTIAGAAMILAAAVPAHAVLFVGNAQVSQGSTVHSNSCAAPIQGPALTVEGCVGPTDEFVVRFEAPEQITYSGGQATLAPGDGLFNELKISVPGQKFNYIEFNIDAKEDGTVVFSNDLGDISLAKALSSNGQNKFSLFGDDFTWVKFTAADVSTNTGTKKDPVLVTVSNMVDIKQVRLSVSGVPDVLSGVPEPSTWTLMIAGFGLIGFAMRRRPANDRVAFG